jgi:putative phage-type endonuclease
MIVRSDVKKHLTPKGRNIPAEWAKTLLKHACFVEKWKTYENFHPKIQTILSQPRIPSKSEEWLKQRMLRITATNTASLLSETCLYGKSPFPHSNRKSLFLKKTGRSLDIMKGFSKAAIEHGIKYEEEASQVYTQVTGIDLVTEDIGMVVHREEECIAATPDKLARYFPINVEIKCPFKRIPLHAVPEYYWSQVQHQMAVLNLEETHFVQYIPKNYNPKYKDGLIDIVIIKFDEVWWQSALVEIKQFYQEVVAYYEKINMPVGTILIDFQKKQEEENMQERNIIIEKDESCYFTAKKRKTGIYKPTLPNRL